MQHHLDKRLLQPVLHVLQLLLVGLQVCSMLACIPQQHLHAFQLTASRLHHSSDHGQLAVSHQLMPVKLWEDARMQMHHNMQCEVSADIRLHLYASLMETGFCSETLTHGAVVSS
jgi:hypothetical protein